ncbi:hypothetical protein HaLaN_12465, partial [Haematococcus lacustris]
MCSRMLQPGRSDSLVLCQAGQSVELWTSDPWDLLHLHRPAAAVEALGGREGLTAFTLLLHLTEQQLRPTLDMLRAHNYCGSGGETNPGLLNQPSHLDLHKGS